MAYYSEGLCAIFFPAWVNPRTASLGVLPIDQSEKYVTATETTTDVALSNNFTSCRRIAVDKETYRKERQTWKQKIIQTNRKEVLARANKVVANKVAANKVAANKVAASKAVASKAAENKVDRSGSDATKIATISPGVVSKAVANSAGGSNKAADDSNSARGLTSGWEL